MNKEYFTIKVNKETNTVDVIVNLPKRINSKDEKITISLVEIKSLLKENNIEISSCIKCDTATNRNNDQLTGHWSFTMVSSVPELAIENERSEPQLIIQPHVEDVVKLKKHSKDNISKKPVKTKN